MFELTFLTKFNCKGIHMSQVFFLLFLYTGITQIFICIIIVWGGLAFFLSLNERAGKIYYLAFIWLRINSLAERMFEINIMTSKDLPNPYPCIKRSSSFKYKKSHKNYPVYYVVRWAVRSQRKSRINNNEEFSQ